MNWKTVVYWPGIVGAIFAGLGTFISALSAQNSKAAFIGATFVCIGIAIPFVHRGWIYSKDVREGKKKLGE